MCTSFIYREQDIIIGMNFDNNGMKYSVDTKNPNWFTVLVDGGRGKYPSFGVDSSGRFFNNLVVNSNGKGLYKRPSKKVTHTTKLITDILNGVICAEKLEDFLKNVEVVNTPDWSCHNMICDSNANVWIIEPGRGNIFSPVGSTSYFAMTNFSLYDYMNDNNNCECNRYKIATSELSKVKEINIDKAFKILDSVKQVNGEWVTSLSVVYSKKTHSVHYCFEGDFNKRYEYIFPSQQS